MSTAEFYFMLTHQYNKTFCCFNRLVAAGKLGTQYMPALLICTTGVVALVFHLKAMNSSVTSGVNVAVEKSQKEAVSATISVGTSLMERMETVSLFFQLFISVTCTNICPAKGGLMFSIPLL